MTEIYQLCFTVLSLWSFAQDYAVDSIPENLLLNANAIIREHSEDYILKSVNDMTVKETHVVTIMSAAGDRYSTVLIPYNPTTKVSNIKVEMLDGAGKVIKTFAKKDFSDYTNTPSAALYVDDRILVLRTISTKYPFTLKTSYETSTSNTIYLSRFSPFNAYNIALEKSNFTITNNSGINIRTKINDKPLAKVSESKDGNVWKYSYQNIPAITHEDLSPSLDYLIPDVEFSPEKFTLAGRQGDLTDWNSFGKWYYNDLIDPVSKISPEISAEVAALNLTGTTSDKVKTLYQYMQNKTRYVLIAMGIGGWQPMPASEVSKKGYGDCKALTNYMRTLLQAAGIPSYFAVIYSDDSVITFDKNFPKLSGNHAILMVPTEKDPIWLENTSQRIAFNHLSYSSHNRNVLAVNENGIKIIDTPTYKPEQSKELLVAKVQLEEDGGITSNANFIFTGGQYDTNLSLFTLKNDEIQEALKNRHYNLQIDKITVDNLLNNRDDVKISYDLNLKVKNFSKKLGNDLFFPVMPFYQTTTFSSNAERKLPFETAFPFQDDYEIEFNAPIGYRFSDLPDAAEFSTEFGSYSILYKMKGEKLVVNRVLTIKKGLYPKEKFKDYVDFRKKTATKDNTKILITKI
ncbi:MULTISPECIES: transglutaminase family protein [unclassified Kaistella]|uniref:transglutaminase-like domain-containing protein n=1 Tax=unclassified Kaistella TaxID=2762626 RepID=UPI0027361E07|nr:MULTISPECIES: transglutaminase family protein [unclassified Kaistella]MDP2452603.1 transglutaminase family protein [Kaistella sp. SH11-4b]MDP2455511.1 transglutaminase family protein [Kaistella sp. SH40-3]MDP2458415.1 transglutaminase family protein [Kaistella sp. SH19-2b]